jgi:integrase
MAPGRHDDLAGLQAWAAGVGIVLASLGAGRPGSWPPPRIPRQNGIASVHPLTGTELRALRRLQREQEPGRYIFMSERGAPMSAVGFRRMMGRLGEVAKMPLPVHPHMLRHACGFKLANDGQDTRALQHYLGRKNIQHTVRYTELSPERFKSFWKD